MTSLYCTSTLKLTLHLQARGQVACKHVAQGEHIFLVIICVVAAVWCEQHVHHTSMTPPSLSVGAPWMYCMALSTLTICFSVSVKDVTTPDRRLVTERAYEMARPTSPKVGGGGFPMRNSLQEMSHTIILHVLYFYGLCECLQHHK